MSSTYYYYHCHCYTYSDRDPCQIDRDPYQIDRDHYLGSAGPRRVYNNHYFCNVCGT